MTERSVDVWFDFASPYSYLGTARVGALAAQRGVRLRWQPFLLGPIFADQGWSNSPLVLQSRKGEHAWRDLERQARKFGLPWRRPSRFPRPAVLPTRIALLGAEQPWCEAFTQAVFSRNFVADEEIDDAAAMAAVLERLGLPAQSLLDAALCPTERPRLRRQVDTARRLGIFGAPTWFVGDEMFWGNDRLEDALEWCRPVG
jgi:2-hydroxychromene-2-carboxylate isomerase